MIEILRPGMLTTVQDGGRKGLQAFGVPVCGAMDWFSLALSNVLAGNDWDEAALEITAMGPLIRFTEDAVFAIAGADFSASLNEQALPANCARLAHTGDVLEFGAASDGFRAYFTVSGGFDLPSVMNSRSTCLAAHFGGYEGRALKKGDKLRFRAPQLWLRNLPNRNAPTMLDPDAPVHVVLGPQDDAFSDKGIEDFFSAPYRFTSHCDRMGCRLEGNEISLKSGRTPNILSDGVVMGSIQVPNGQPILMMADRQTTGGYVKLGTVISADLPLIGQKKPGGEVQFVRTTVQAAQQLRRDRRRQLKNLFWELERGNLW